jgi:hypothetical protein
MARNTDDAENDLHSKILEVLLDKVREDPFPSVTMLDLIEQSLRPEDVRAYTDVLMEKVTSDQFPSLDHLTRLQAFA